MRRRILKLIKVTVALLVVSLLYLQFGPQGTADVPRWAPLFFGISGYIMVVFVGLPALKNELADRPEKGCFLGPLLFALAVAYSAGPLLFGLGLIVWAVYAFLHLAHLL